jgi:hypothetical protein
MPWYIPIIAATLGAVGGWIIRHFYDARVERSVLRREIFKDYFRMRLDGVHGLLAIQRAGALRLPVKEFGLLVKDVTRCGHPPGSLKDHSDTNSLKDLYEVLLFAASQEYEIHDAQGLYDAQVEMATQRPDKASRA